jgi:hypothetical protein
LDFYQFNKSSGLSRYFFGKIIENGLWEARRDLPIRAETIMG